jgi:hypothetical protein
MSFLQKLRKVHAQKYYTITHGLDVGVFTRW